MPVPSRAVMVTLVGLTAIALVQSPTRAQQPPSSVSTEHDFDFLVGNWEFTAESKIPGTPPTYEGRWTAERTGDEALVEDDFRVSDDQGHRVYLGVTIRAFSPKTKHWTTAFVVPHPYLPRDSGANWSLGTAWREGNEMREGPLDAAKGIRAHFYDIAPDHFSWSMDQSTDGGKTWINDVLRVRARRMSAAQHPVE